MELSISGLQIMRRLVARIGPYAVVEILLPGGTLLALMFYFYRRRKSDIGQDSLRTAMAWIPLFRSDSDEARGIARIGTRR